MFSESHDHNDHSTNHDHPRRGSRGFTPGVAGFSQAFGPGFGGFGPRGFRPPAPPRKRRGDVRSAIISLLLDAPANGYSLIKGIAERSGGTWTPSPGSVYPSLQQLVDEELIEAVGEGRRTEFQLTDAGRTYAAEHEVELEKLWDATAADANADAAMHQSIGKLMGVVHQFRFAATDAQRAAAVEKLDETRRALYGILAE